MNVYVLVHVKQCSYTINEYKMRFPEELKLPNCCMHSKKPTQLVFNIRYFIFSIQYMRYRTYSSMY